jgi:hypothetical protein
MAHLSSCNVSAENCTFQLLREGRNITRFIGRVNRDATEPVLLSLEHLVQCNALYCSHRLDGVLTYTLTNESGSTAVTEEKHDNSEYTVQEGSRRMKYKKL